MSCDTLKKKEKKNSSSYLHKPTWDLGQCGWTGQNKASYSG